MAYDPPAEFGSDRLSFSGVRLPARPPSFDSSRTGLNNMLASNNYRILYQLQSTNNLRHEIMSPTKLDRIKS